MKNNKLHVLVLTVFLLSSVLKAQWCVVPSLPQSTPVNQPTNCIQLLNDLIPQAGDPTLDVNIYFWVFAPTTNSTSAAWTNSLHPMSQSLLQQCLDGANTTFTTIPAVPKLPVIGAGSITNAKIRLVLKGWQVVYHDFAYRNTAYQGKILSGQWNDPNAINVYLGTQSVVATFTNYATNPPTIYKDTVELERIATDTILGVYPKNYVMMTPAFHKLGTHPLFYDHIEMYGKSMAHEVSHILGLDHPNASYTVSGPPLDTVAATPSFIKPNFGCCSYIEHNDVYMEPDTLGFGGCNDPGASDNLMSQNVACNRYLSPQQAAIMQYNLRTVLKDFLTAPSLVAALDVNTALNYSVTSNETWTSDRYFKGNIIIRTNKTLTIKCAVAMSTKAKIIVEQGALLVIDGGTVTTINGGLWDGIFIKGNPFQSQLVSNPNNPGATLYQGMLRMKNNATISQASIGVRNYYNNTGNSGGVIFAQDANFINNVMDVQMSGQYMVNFTPVPSVSWFYNCSFKTTGPIGNGWQVPKDHVYLLNVSGVKFRGCTFKNETGSSFPKGNGIFSTDAIYTVDKNVSVACVFENLDKAIHVNNINPLKAPVIINTEFKDNAYGAYFMNTNYLVLQTNTFVCVNSQAISNVYLNNCKYYKVKNNGFSSNPNLAAAGEGVAVYKSKTGAHEIYRNSFENLHVAINCMDDNGNANSLNDGVKMNCNDFHITPNDYDVVLSYSAGLALPTVNKTQGIITSVANATNVVRNIYGATCGNQNMWQIYSGSTITINHGANTNSVTAVTQPTAAGCKSSYLNVVDKNIQLHYPNHCPASPPSSGGTSSIPSHRMSDMNEYLSTLRAQREIDLINLVEPDDFEIQSTIASKLNLFLTDSSVINIDSVTAILEGNRGFMEDADIQTVFAYMHKGDLSTAQDKVNALETHRSDWKDVLTELISFCTDTVSGIDSIGAGYTTFFDTYASSADLDGKALAQALLKAAGGADYNEPHALPENESASRMMGQQAFQTSGVKEFNVQVHPNPTNSGIYIQYSAAEEGFVTLELKDLLGSVIYTNFIKGSSGEHYISMSGVKAGMYLFSLTKNDELVYKTKIIKVD